MVKVRELTAGELIAQLEKIGRESIVLIYYAWAWDEKNNKAVALHGQGNEE